MWLNGSRSKILLLLLALVLLGMPTRPARGNPGAALAGQLVWRAAQHLFAFAIDYSLGKAVDYALLDDIEDQLEDWLPQLKAEASMARGGEGSVLRERAHEVEGLLKFYRGFANRAYTRDEAKKLEKELRSLAAKYGALEGRTAVLERSADKFEGLLAQHDQELQDLAERLGRVEHGLAQIEEAKIADCKDMTGRGAATVSRFRVLLDEGAVYRSEVDEIDGVRSVATIYLNACTEDFYTRGILIVLQTTTAHRSSQWMEAVVTFKDLEAPRMRSPTSNHISRQNIRLFQPGLGVEGRISEIFLPHDRLPTSDASGRLGLAVVLLQDGQLLFNAEQGLTCYVGKPLRCDWILSS